ncbi:MAG: hypothetical protein ACJ746_02290 [Bryobacteraceae bacterium]
MNVDVHFKVHRPAIDRVTHEYVFRPGDIDVLTGALSGNRCDKWKRCMADLSVEVKSAK